MFASLRHRLIAGLGLLLLLGLAVVLIGIRSLAFVQREAERELLGLTRLSALETAMVVSIADQVRTAEAHLAAPSPGLTQTFLQLGDSTHAFRRQFRQIEGLSPQDQSTLNAMEDHQARMEVAYAQAHVLRDLGRAEEAAAAALRAAGPSDSLVLDMRALSRRQQDRVQATIDAIRTTARRRQAVVWVLFVTTIGFGVATAFLTLRSIESPLDQLIEAARRFGDGDLRPVELGAMPTELATLARAMGQTGSRLRGVIDTVVRESQGIAMNASDLSAMSEELASASHEISRAIGGVKESGERQVTEVRDADTVIGLWRESAARDVSTAERVVAEGDQIRALAERQHADLTAAARSLDALRSQLGQAGDQARELTRRADAVGELVDIGRQLVAQCEVLALNAAIEASRAAEHGAGMSAIADQTRQLAETSRTAVQTVAAGSEALRQLTEALTTLLHGTATEALSAESATERTRVAAAEVLRASATMRDSAVQVVRSVTENREVSLRVAALRGRVETGARDNVATSEAVSSAATEQASATGEIAEAAASLLEASERLAALVGGFRL
jgi:methyl-accepting chemotaxis protein